MLNMVKNGTGETTPLLIAHGLFGSARNWGVLSKRLSDKRPVVAVDMRNHGTSPRFESNSYDEMMDDLADVISAQGGAADVLGHSMGGKAAMVLALRRPELVNRLIIADIAPVQYNHTQNHLIEAMQAIDLNAVSSRRDADRLLAQTVNEAAVRAFLLQSLDFKGSAPRWMLNLDVLKAEMPGIIGFPEIGGQYSGPTLFLTGGASDYVRAEHKGRILQLFPQVEFHKIKGAGHWLHAENPYGFETAVRSFLGG